LPFSGTISTLRLIRFQKERAGCTTTTGRLAFSPASPLNASDSSTSSTSPSRSIHECLERIVATLPDRCLIDGRPRLREGYDD